MKKFLAGILAVSLSVCAFASCGQEDTAGTDAVKSSDGSSQEEVIVYSDDFACRESFEKFFEALNEKDWKKLSDVCYEPVYMEQLEEVDSETYYDVLEELYATASYNDEEEDDSGYPFYEYEVKSIGNADEDMIKEYNDKFARRYERIGLEPVEVTEGNKVSFELTVRMSADEEPVSADADFYFYLVNGKWLFDIG